MSDHLDTVNGLGRRMLLLSAASLALVGCTAAGAGGSGNGADLVIYGGPILTMEGNSPAYVEAVVVDDGKIVFAGDDAAAMKLKSSRTVVKNLGGKTLMPGFIDGHAHVQQFGTQAIGANLLAPPDGGVNTVDDVVAKLKEFGASPDVNITGWIFGLGYDDAILGRHPTREDLDKVSSTVPVMAVHISGHFISVNTAGLKVIGYDASTKDPQGGLIRREADGKTPNGVLEELAAMQPMMALLTPKTQEGKDLFLKRGLEMAKSYGYTTGNEGRMFGKQSADMEALAARDLIDIDIIGWVDYTGLAELDRAFSKDYKSRYRLGGLKITLDGSPQGRTAWRTTPYILPPEGLPAGYKGYPAIPDTKQVEKYLDEAYAKDWPVKVHANGDAAIDQMFAALEPVVKKHGIKPGQVILIHGQFIRPDQVKKLKSLGVFPSMFPMHTFYWGDWYPQIVEPNVAAGISPMRSILNEGLHATSHTDAPVALPNLMQVAWATVNRVSRSGKIVGAKEKVTPFEAMQMITIWGAEQYGEQAVKGSIAQGKIADFVVLTDNPVSIDPMKINQIKVLETMKDGKTIWVRK